MPSRLAELIKRARRLAAERDRLVQELAAEWARPCAASGCRPRIWKSCGPVSPRRPCARQLPPARASGRPQAWRAEAHEVIARVKERVEVEAARR